MNTTRRDFLKTAAAGFVYARSQNAPAVAPTGGTTLLRGGRVLSLDPAVGDFDKADVLIQGSKIMSVQPNIRASGKVIDASNMIIMPGFVDTHRHAWEGPLRNILPNGLLSDYTRDITGAARAAYRPEDAYIGDLVIALGAINAGVTTMLDWSHIGNSPEHTDAAIRGLKESGIRGVYAYGGGAPGASNQFPQDIRRLRKQYFSSEDQLLTLAMAAGLTVSDWAVAREVGAPITVHVNGANQLVPIAKDIKSDVTCVHANNLTEAEWQIVAKAGAHISVACPIEMEMGHGVPAIQPALDHGIKPSLSLDVETEMPGDFFTQMRSVFTLQRMQRLARERAGEKNLPALLTVREVLEFATLQGAKDNRLERKVGTLTPGKEADIIMLRTDQINVMPVNNSYGAVVLGMDTSNVDTVFIAGKLMKSQGKLLGVDMTRLSRLLQQSREYIVSKTGIGRG
jgi:cytosine/adenosine deaminase-related metal-dependent hydrolase